METDIKEILTEREYNIAKAMNLSESQARLLPVVIKEAQVRNERTYEEILNALYDRDIQDALRGVILGKLLRQHIMKD